MLKVLIADDHPVVRKGLKRILLEDFSGIHISEAGDAHTLVEKAMQESWDLVISDMAMPGGGGLEALKQIRGHFPALPVIILSIYPEEQYAYQVMKNGAHAYINKDYVAEQLVEAVRCILRGQRWMPQDKAILKQLLDEQIIQSHDLLTENEMHVFRLVAAGNENADIAAQMKTSIGEVNNIYSSILSKTGLQNSADIIAYATGRQLL